VKVQQTEKLTKLAITKALTKTTNRTSGAEKVECPPDFQIRSGATDGVMSDSQWVSSNIQCHHKSGDKTMNTGSLKSPLSHVINM